MNIFPQNRITDSAIGLTGFVFLAGLIFFVTTSIVFAACGEKQERSFISSFLNSVFSPVEKIIKDFGYDVVLATAPDPDNCGSDNVVCVGGAPQATISWTGAPNPLYTQSCPYWWNLSYYILTVQQIGDINTGLSTSHVVSGLLNDTMYSWSVEAYYCSWACIPSSACGITIRPSGSFRTPNCALTPTPKPTPTLTLTPTPIRTPIPTPTRTPIPTPTHTPIPTPILIPPTVTITADGVRPQLKIAEGWSVNLDWTSTGATACAASGAWSGAVPVSDNSPAYTFTPSVGIHNYTITCTGPGGTVNSSVLVDVVSPILTLVRGSQTCLAVNLSWSWNDPFFNGEYSQYRVLRSEDGLVFSERAIVNAPQMSYQDNDNFTSDRTYYYRIEALKSGSPSVFSNTIQTIPCPRLPRWEEIRPR